MTPVHTSNPRWLTEFQYPLPRNARGTPMTGETASTPGLAVVPHLGSAGQGQWEFTGGWEVRHTVSGLSVPVGYQRAFGLGHARDALVLLAELPIDWDRPGRDVTEACRRERGFGDVVERLRAAVAASRPARASASWEQLDRSWFLYNLLDDDVGDDAFDSYAEAAEERRDLAHRGEGAGWVIRQEETETWALRCAAEDCRTSLSEDGPVADADPATVAEFATDARWRRLDAQHWLCPPCSSLFTPAES